MVSGQFCQKHLSSEISFSVFSPDRPSPAVTLKPSSLPFSEQSLNQSSAASQPDKPKPPVSLTSQAGGPQPNPASVSKQEERISLMTEAKPAPQHSEAEKQPMKEQRDDGSKAVHSLEEAELVQSSVVPWPLPSSTNTTSMHSDIKHTNTLINKIHNETKNETATDPCKSLETGDNKDVKHSKSPSLKRSQHPTKSVSTLTEDLHKQTHTPDHQSLTKDEQLQQEERHLLAKLQLMTGETSPASSSHTMKRLLLAPGDIDCDPTEPKGQSETPTELTDHSKHSVIPHFDALQEISLTETEEPLGEEDE